MGQKHYTDGGGGGGERPSPSLPPSFPRLVVTYHEREAKSDRGGRKEGGREGVDSLTHCSGGGGCGVSRADRRQTPFLPFGGGVGGVGVWLRALSAMLALHDSRRDGRTNSAAAAQRI